MQTHSRPLRRLITAFIFSLSLLILPLQALAEDAAPEEGSKSKDYSHGSPHGGSPHGKAEGSGYKHGSGMGHDSPHGYKKNGGSHGYSKGHHGGGGHHGGYSGHGGHGRDPFYHILRFAHALELTKDQVQQIKDNQFAFKKQRIELKAQHRIAHLELDKLVHSGNVDESAIRAVGDKLKQIKSQKIDGMIEAKIMLLKLLTDEQKKKIATLHAHGGGKGHEYKGHHK